MPRKAQIANRAGGGAYLKRNWELYLFVVPALIYLLLYCYYPMYGVQIAFKNFRVTKGIAGSEWVGLEHFRKFFSNPSCRALIKNTLVISLYSLVVGFPLPIIFALTLNEVAPGRYKKLVQTVSYAPHFISTVVMVSMLTMFLNADNGIFNKIVETLGGSRVDYMSKANLFPTVYVLSGVWQSLGWSSVIYLSALSGIDTGLHEAAMIDGASRLQRIWHINLTGILPTITIMLILQVGNLMTVGFEKAFLMQNPLNLETSEIISTFVYKMGLNYRQYSYSTAIGLFNSVINMILLVSVNTIAGRLSETSLW